MIGKIFKSSDIRNNLQIKEEERNEFNELLTDSNIKTCRSTVLALLLLNVVMILVDLKVYRRLEPGEKAYIYQYYAHITESIIIIIWLVFISLKRKTNCKRFGALSYYLYIYLPDIRLEENEVSVTPINVGSSNIERINVEFSDIYE